MRKRKVVIITSGQPSLNPRLVKEADLLAEIGDDVTVIYQYWNNWATELDNAILKDKKWNAIRIGGDPFTQKISYWYTRLRHKISVLMLKTFGFIYNLPELAIGRCTIELTKTAQKIKAEVYISHNLAALPAAVNAAKKNNAYCGFDAEDFHRQEVSDDLQSLHYQLVKYIEDKYLQATDYFTAASPKIAAHYKALYPQLNPSTINNVFPIKNLVNFEDKINSKELKLFWFSQTIGPKRGIEDAIAAIGSLKNSSISLTLLGDISQDQLHYFKTFATEAGLNPSQLQFLAPVQPEHIFKLAKNYDIGLALETGFCLNNNIALSNKIFTYLTSGLAIIASETSAQKEFTSTYSKVGKSYPIHNIKALAALINFYIQNNDQLTQAKKEAHLLAKNELNWEKESIKFLKLVTKPI